MNKMNPKVDIYFTEGCGRCRLMNTPQCKVHKWDAELEKLRTIILDCGLDEELKWGQPCYTFQKSNVVLLASFNDSCVISFFKGALLTDAGKILSKPGKNTQAGRVVRFTDVRKIIEMESVLKVYINEAVEVARAGLKVDYQKIEECTVPEELQSKLDEIPALKTAFNALTPGRRRGYILYFSAPKQSITRESRIERSMPQILIGRGLHD